MRLFLIVFGSLKTAGMNAAADHYRRLLKPWAKLEEIEIKPILVPDKSTITRQRISHQEELLFLKTLRQLSLKLSSTYLLDETGKTLESRDWAKQYGRWQQEGSAIALGIGSSLGFSQNLKKQPAGLLSLGPQTLSHELARLNLLEQLYRALSILHHHPYHNEG